MKIKDKYIGKKNERRRKNREEEKEMRSKGVHKGKLAKPQETGEEGRKEKRKEKPNQINKN